MLALAKMMVLPVNDSAREQVIKSYGTDNITIENVVNEWFKKNFKYDEFLQPINLTRQNNGEKYISQSPSIGRSDKKSTLSPGGVPTLAKVMTLPENVNAREQVIKPNGTDRFATERLVDQWMQDYLNGKFLKPRNLTSQKIEEKYKSLSGTDAQYTLNPKAKSNLQGRLWGNGGPQLQTATFIPGKNTRSLRENEKLENKQLTTTRQTTKSPNTSKQVSNNPALNTTPGQNPVAPEKINSSLYLAKIEVFAKNLTSTTANYSILHHSSTSDAVIAEVHEIIEHTAEEEEMYDYKTPNLDELPKLPAFETTTSSTYPSSMVAYFSTMKVYKPPPPPPHPMVARAHKQMLLYGMSYLSAFITTFCEIVSIKKDGKVSPLIHGLAFFVGKYLDDRNETYWLGDTGPSTRTMLKNIVERAFQMTPSIVRSNANTIYQYFHNHSYFLYDSRAIVEEIESWYTVEEGEKLLDTLAMVSDWPNENKLHSITYKEIIQAILKPYVRKGPNSRRRIILVQDLESLIINRFPGVQNSFRSHSYNHTNKDKQLRGKTPAANVSSANKTEMQHKGNLTAKNRFKIVNTKEKYNESRDYDTKEENEVVDKKYLRDVIKMNFYPITNKVKNKHEANGKIIKNLSKYSYKFITLNQTSYQDLIYSKGNRKRDEHKKNHRATTKYTGNKYRNLSNSPKKYQNIKFHKHPIIYTNLPNDIDHTLKMADISRNKNKHNYESKIYKTKKYQTFDEGNKNYEKEIEQMPVAKPGVKKNILLKWLDLNHTTDMRKNLPKIQKRFKTVNPKQEIDMRFDNDGNESINENQKIKYVEEVSHLKEDKDIYQRFYENFEFEDKLTDKNNSTEIFEDSDHSDAEFDMKLKLSDALRHGDEIMLRNSRRINMPERKVIRDLTSETDTEGIFKSNIYRAIHKINKIHGRH